MRRALVSAVGGAAFAVLLLFAVSAAAEPRGVFVAQADVGSAAGHSVTLPAPDAGASEGSGSAAAPAPALPDPLDAPVESASTLYKLYKSGGLIPSIIVGLFMLLTVLSRKVKWLQSGNRALVVAGALGALAILVEPASRGTTPNLSMMIAALGSGLALAMNPKKPSEAK